MVFTRPADVPYPAVHRRFTVSRCGAPVALRVQDLTAELRGPALELLSRYFTRDEPPCKYIGINNHPNAVKELQKLWSDTMKDDLSLVCVEDVEGGGDEQPRVIAVNVLTVLYKGDKEEPFQTEDKIWAKLFGAVELVSKSVDVFAHFGVDKYLTAYGLVVWPEWRGLNIGRHLLEARSVDVFTHFGVDKYLTAYGLVVWPEWHGLNIGRHLLEARCVDVVAHFGVDKYLTAYGLVVWPEWRGLNIGRHLLEARCVDVFAHFGVYKYLTAYGLVVWPEWRGLNIGRHLLEARCVDVFAHFGVDKYLTAYGMVVWPEWRGLNIGRLLLEARIPLCRALGVRVTATVFTAAASQALAHKAGFQELAAVSYAELARQGLRFPGIEQDTASSKLMALRVE